MANVYTPAAQPTIYFIGVTTGSSSIMKVFPKWAKALGLKVDEGDGHCDVALSMGPARAEVLASGRADAKAGRRCFARLLPKGRRPEQTRRGHFALPVATKGPLGKARKPA